MQTVPGYRPLDVESVLVVAAPHLPGPAERAEEVGDGKGTPPLALALRRKEGRRQPGVPGARWRQQRHRQAGPALPAHRR